MSSIVWHLRQSVSVEIVLVVFTKKIDEPTSLTQLIQFLIGVYETFNNEGSQILLLDRLPSVKKAFSMLYTVEQQRAIQTTTKISTNNVAYQLTMKGTKRDDDKKKGRAFAANVDVKSEGMQGTSMGNTAEMMSELIKLL
ncbi:UNVERIFIED_CONTAM: hypothetical protein Sindi_1856100 [Sesamum indicum]